ncbi:MAG TPA: sigma-54 dependent transcriptional regulator [Terriglobales bacterium]|nr:sigma-54 dependent transcriptional regulator [Terriglobales bacterium]
MNQTFHRNNGAHETLRLLIVGRDASTIAMLKSLASSNAWGLEMAGSGCEALERLQDNHTPNLVIVDLAHGDADGMYTLRWLRRMRPSLPVVLLGFADDTQHDEAIRLGAGEYLLKPATEQKLSATIRRHMPGMETHEANFTEDQIIQVREDRFFMAAGPLMRKLQAQAELLSQVDVPLLVFGESGSGKETVARLIHKLSVRSTLPFLKVNCAALPPDLLERELFGYDAGSFPGQVRPKPGKLELAEKGTIFLDDIADIPANLQAKLLHVLQEKQFSRPGSGTTVKVDVRIVAATGVDVERAMMEKRLREDFYYRLSAFTVHVPSLRQRKEEIPLLLGHFMNQLARHYGLPTRSLSAETLSACQDYKWPGNLRELESFVKRYLVMGHEELILGEARWNQGNGGNGLREHRFPTQTAEPVRISEPVTHEDHTSGLRSLVQTVKGEAERNAIAVALDQTRWNRKAAARLLKVSYRTLLYKIQQYHMSPPPTYGSTSFVGSAVKGNGHGPQ